ncbi:meiotic recombination protein REC114 [Prionailurus iriomotensis]
MAEAGKEPAGLAFPGGGATQWPLQRYGRFMPSGTGEPPGPGQGAGTASSLTWKVFDSSEESGYLVLTIVISGHFFISQGPTLLEGFSLIGSKNWLKINKSRMFRHRSLLVSEELSTVYEQSAWDTEDLRPFLRLCLMDQNFPAFVEEVEKELKKLTGLRN